MTLTEASWQEQGACRGQHPSKWYPEKPSSKGTLRYRAGAWRLRAYGRDPDTGRRFEREQTVEAPPTDEGRRQAEAALTELTGETSGSGKAICVGCPVRRQCLEAGLYEEFGIWGGLTPAERAAEVDRRDLADKRGMTGGRLRAQRAYRAANRDAIAARMRARRAKRIKRRGYQSAYRERNREAIRAKQREYYATHREAEIARARDWTLANRERAAASHARWWAAHKDERNARRRVTTTTTEGTPRHEDRN